MSRFGRGLTERKISKDAIEKVTAIITIQQGSDTTLKSSLTTKELRDALAIMKGACDTARIPNKPYVVDLAVEIQRAIDDGLAKTKEESATRP